LAVGRDLRLFWTSILLNKRILQKFLPSSLYLKKIFTLIYFSQMAEGVWTGSYCLSVEGFPKLLYATMQKLGIKDRPEYEGIEYEEHETERCELPSILGNVRTFLT